ncbi:DUF6117 family protein [Sphingomonas sp. AP4-R1]|uniref:DUF6117 family protein n=1 Tax=Sphingomonas sp. AP4-R1 TaxID=2735134 RepID=UPI001C110AE4|nr:DUF6117 family protein [Sphingomonas sp. AP4-R1]
MAIPDARCRIFDTLLRAALAGDLILIEFRDASGGETRFVIRAVGRAGNSNRPMTLFRIYATAIRSGLPAAA